jgi:hypothetical protein
MNPLTMGRVSLFGKNEYGHQLTMRRDVMRRQLAFIALLLAGFSGYALPAAAQEHQTRNTLKMDPNARPAKATIADISWLAGHWIGEGLGGTTEEVWAPPLGNSMMGMYRLVKNGKVVFSELLFIVETGDSLVLKLKHFDADFKGWEAKDVALSFPLVKLGPREAFFDGMTIRAPESAFLEAFVAIRRKSGEITEEAFRYKAAKPR